MPSQREKCERFAQLHQQQGGFIIPNPWDMGSARLLQGMGFMALATTSSGFAFTAAKSDGDISLKDKLKHCRELAAVTDIPINVDFENGFADDPGQVAENVLRVAATGVAGCSIEDFSRDQHQIYDAVLAQERVQAAAEAVATLDMHFQLTARAENLIRGVDDIEDTIERLQAFESAGADVLYAPGIKSLESIKLVTGNLNKPFNALAPFIPGATADEIYAAGAKRISVGGALAFTCVQTIIDAGKEMLEQGSFDWCKNKASGAELKNFMDSQANF